MAVCALQRVSGLFPCPSDLSIDLPPDSWLERVPEVRLICVRWNIGLTRRSVWWRGNPENDGLQPVLALSA